MGLLMKTNAIRINDKEDAQISVNLPDILAKIHNGDEFFWSILFLYASGNLGDGNSIVEFENKINGSESGLLISWQDLHILSHKFFQVIDILIIGSKNESLLHKYTSDHEMYETCNIVVQMIDGSYWEAFSHDRTLIDRLAASFEQIKLLNTWEDVGDQEFFESQ